MLDYSVVDLDGPHVQSQPLNTDLVEIVDLEQCDSAETLDAVEIVDLDRSGMVNTDCVEVVDVDRFQINKESIEEVSEVVVIDDEASFEYFGCARVKVVGLRYYSGTIHIGEMIILRREPTNMYDENAIQAINMERSQIGHVNRKAAKVLAHIMDNMDRVKIDASTPNPPIRARNGTIYDVIVRLDFYGAPDVFEEVKKRLKAPPACIELDEVPERFGGTGVNAIGVTRELQQERFDSQKEIEQLYDRLAAEVKSFDFEEPSDFGLTSKLYPHQRQAVAWMLKKERQNPTELSPLWTERREGGKTVFYSRITNSSYMDRPQPVRGGLVADEMGLGKTIQIIALILANPPTKGGYATKIIDHSNQGSEKDGAEGRRTEKKGKKSKERKPSKSAAADELSSPSLDTRTTLIVCPLSVMHNWSQQIKSHTRSGSLDVYVYYGPNREKDPRVLERFDVVLATYATLTNEWAIEESWNEKLEIVKKRKREPLGLPHCNFWRVVLDEAHQIRNPKTKTAKAVCALRAVNRWALTGTPVQNKLADMGSLLKFLRVEPLSSSRIFKQAIIHPADRGDPAGFACLRAIVASVCLRRTKENIPEIAASLPGKQVELVRVQMTKEQRDLYDMYYSAAKRAFALAMTAGTNSVSSNFGSILEVLLRLRQMCCAPCLVPPGLFEAARDVLKKVDKYGFGPDKQVVILPEQAKELFEILAGRLRNSEDRFCAVCLEEVTEDSVRINRLCRHSFCEECLSNLFRVSSGEPTCPLCRRPFGRGDLITVHQLKTLSSAPKVEKDPDEERTDVHTANRGAKTEIFMKEIESMPKEDKAVAFSQFTKYLDVVEAKLVENGWVRGTHYERLDGTVNHAKRGIMLSQFQEDPELRLLLVSLKAGGAGLNLTSACRVLMLDCWWNCAVEEQAQDRVHRIGQVKDVRIVRLIADSSIEELILELHERKQILSKSAVSRLSPVEQRKALLNRFIRLFEYDTSPRVRET